MQFIVQHRMPAPGEYNHLRGLAEWPTFPDEVIALALSNTYAAVCITTESNTIVGMGRVISDGAIYFHIQDVIVHPEYQRMGVGKLIMDALMEKVNAATSKNSMIGLMCSKGREPFYKSYGFIERPNERFGAGMVQIVN